MAKLITREGQTVYPHDFVIVDESGQHWVMDSWDLGGSIYVLPACFNPEKHRGRHRRHVTDFKLRISA